MSSDYGHQKLRTQLSVHSKVILNAFVIALWLTASVMFTIMALGIVKIFEGILWELHFNRPDPYTHNSSLIEILRGLEFIFLSPLFYLLILSLTKYISATRPEIDADDLDRKKKYMNHAILEITNVKILSVSLFISVLILHLLAGILEYTMSTSDFIFPLVFLAVLIGYYFLLDVLAERLKKTSH